MTKPLPPWLEAAQRLLDEALAGARPPHALLLQGAEGLGPELLAAWMAASVLCRSDGGRPCGKCWSCSAVGRNAHPDLAWLTPLEGSKQIRIDEVRELIADLTLKSHQGGYKIAIIFPAEALNANAANALLKTLEEPAPGTLLMLVAHRRARLPATIISRCQRLVIPTPPLAIARAWLEREVPGLDSSMTLRFARGAPLRALELAAREFERVDREMNGIVGRLERARLDVPAAADEWTRVNKAGFADRLTWLETWVTESIMRAMCADHAECRDRTPRLPAANETQKIRGLYRVLDRLRQIKISSATSLNMTMAVESLLLDLQHALIATVTDPVKGVGRE
jgi:DNA polymerase III subunit delta'